MSDEEPRPSLAFDQPDAFVADAIGEPGQRVFFLQVRQGPEVVSLKCEKAQVAALVEHLGQLLVDLPPAEPAEVAGAITPVDLAWTVGALGLAYDTEDDRVVVVAQEFLPGAESTNDDPEAGDEPAEDQISIEIGGDAATARVSLTRPQVLAFIAHAAEVVGAGRPPCPICGRPMDPTGHVCPRSNGHGRAAT